MSERRPVDDARRRLESASSALSEFRRLSGAPDPNEAGDAAAATGLRAALEQARAALEERSRDLELSRARVADLERALDAARAAAPVPDSPTALDRARRAEEEARHARESAAEELGGLKGRLSLQQAELVRLEALRRKAEEASHQAEQSRRSVEETLRRELRSAHAALDRSASEAGGREARAQSDAQSLQRRLDAALARLEQVQREQRVDRENRRAERERLAAALQRAAAVNASLRRELASVHGEADARVAEMTRRLERSEAEVEVARKSLEGSLERARVEVEERTRGLGERLEALESELARARARLGEMPAGAESGVGSDPSGGLASALVARLRPAAAAAYERLRELSATVPLSEEERAPLRRAASALSGLCGTIEVLERFLDDGPAGVSGPVGLIVSRVAADWDAALRRKGCRLDVKVARSLPDAVRDPADLRLALDQLLRNAFEVLPVKTRIKLSAAALPDGGVEIVLEDDGPGLPAAAAADPSRPLDAARHGRLGLGLAFAARAARRWGGELTVGASPAGGARVSLRLARSSPLWSSNAGA